MMCGIGIAQEISFKETSHDFGEVVFKGVATYEFIFENTGKEPLILTQPKSSCGCTVAEWPKEPILPGKTGKITVTYKTTNKPGVFNKIVTVFSNAKENKEVKLAIKGKVLEGNDTKSIKNDKKSVVSSQDGVKKIEKKQR